MEKRSGAARRVKSVALILSVLLATFGSQSLAGGVNSQSDESKPSPRHETIFANLNYFGHVTELLAVNTFLRPDREIVDYGRYAEIVNLTGKAKPQIEGERIIFTLDGEDAIFRYQGLLKSNELPWAFEIGYFLDGKSIEPENLAGASGRLRIEVDVKQNPEAQRYFAENFMVQLSIPLAMDKATSIKAPSATKMYVGNTVTLAFTLMPDSADLFFLEADVQDFAMEGINIAAMKAEIDLGQMGQDLESGFTDMAEGMEEMIEGTEKLQEGMVELNEGVEKLYGGVDGIASGNRELITGMEGYAAGFSVLATGLGKLGSGAVEEVEAGLGALPAGKEQLEQLALGLMQNPDPQVRILAKAMLGQLKGIEQLNGLAKELEVGFGGINTAARSLSEGLEGITIGAGELEQNTAALPAEVQKLIDGQKEMKEGIIEAKSEIAEFAEGEEGQTVSFVSPGKANAQSVQFVMRTPPVEIPEKPEPPDDREAEKNVWQRFLELFRGISSRFTLSPE